jgi:hypothetical protein
VVISMLPAVQRNNDGRIDCGLTPTECQMTVGPGGGK